MRSSTGQVVRLDSVQDRTAGRKKAMRLTEDERRILLADLAEITAELDDLHERAATITARVARTSARLVRPA